MARLLKVWIIDPRDMNKKPQFETVARHINDADYDTMEKQAIDILTQADYTIRTLNHCPDGNLIAYVHSKNLKAPDATPIAGWVFKRPDVPPTT